MAFFAVLTRTRLSNFALRDNKIAELLFSELRKSGIEYACGCQRLCDDAYEKLKK